MSAICFTNVVAERKDIAAIAHRNRETNRGAAIDAEHRLRWIDETPAHGGDVTEPEDAFAGDEVDRLDVAFVIECARNAQEHALVAGLDDAGGPDDVLRLQGRDDSLVVEAQAGQPFGRKLDIDLLVLRAQHFDLRHVGHLQQPRTRGLDVVAQLAECEAVGGKRVDDAVGVAEIVVEERADDAGGKRTANITDVLAHLVPDVGHLGRRRRLLEIDEDRRLPGRCVAAHRIEMVRFLELALEALGDLQQRFLDSRAGPGRRDDHRPEREHRVLAAAQSQKRQRACDHGDDHQEENQRALAERPFGKIGADHCLVSSKRTFWPGRRACTPAVTTTSPEFKPDATTTLAKS